MPKFKLPFIVYGSPKQNRFVNVVADTISAAAAKAEEFLRAKFSTPTKLACVAVAEIDYTFRDANGRPIPRPQPQPQPQPYRRRRRGGWRNRW